MNSAISHAVMLPCLENSQLSETKLFYCILSSKKLCCNDPNGGEHRKTAIVELPFPHLLGVLIQAKWVTKIAWFLVGAFSPSTKLQNTCHCKQCHKASAARERCGR